MVAKRESRNLIHGLSSPKRRGSTETEESELAPLALVNPVPESPLLLTPTSFFGSMFSGVTSMFQAVPIDEQGPQSAGEADTVAVAKAKSMILTAEESDVLMEKIARADALLEEEQRELNDQAADLYVSKFNEEVEIREKMEKMEAIMAQELEELAAQDRIIEIDRKENMLNPSDEGARAEASTGDDGFSKEMTDHGLKHMKEGKEEVRLKHEMLPPALDMSAFFGDDSTT